jgi:hypothetical protein
MAQVFSWGVVQWPAVPSHGLSCQPFVDWIGHVSACVVKLARKRSHYCCFESDREPGFVRVMERSYNLVVKVLGVGSRYSINLSSCGRFHGVPLLCCQMHITHTSFIVAPTIPFGRGIRLDVAIKPKKLPVAGNMWL